MGSLEPRRLLELCILDFMAKRGYHQTAEVFSREIMANTNPVDINYPEGFLIDWWSAFYEAFSSKFPEVSLLPAESFDKVMQTVQNVVPNMNSVNPPDAPSHIRANISNVMSSSPMMLPHHLIGSSLVVASSSPNHMDPKILDVLSSIGTKSTVPNLSPQRDLTSSLKLLKISNMDGMLPSASNFGYPLQQIPTVPLHWKARDDIHDINLGRHMRMEENICASVNALGPCIKPSDAGTSAGNKKSLRQAFQHGLHLVGVGSAPPVISHQVAHPSVIVPTQKDQFCPQGDVRMLSDTNKINLEKLIVDQQIIAPVGEIQQRKISGKQTTVEEPMNQLRLKSSNKVLVWDLKNSNVNIGEGHAHVITDIPFRPNSKVFATSSFDKTVMIWEAAKPSNPLRNLVGHAEHVMSTDFHPTKMDLLSSCDSNDEIRLWDVNKGDCRAILRGGSRKVRFQPNVGNLLASCTGNVINIFDVTTNKIQRQILEHVRDIRSICWDMSGNYLASVSEDSARIWSVTDGKCIYELCSGGNKFQSCIFSPGHG